MERDKIGFARNGILHLDSLVTTPTELSRPQALIIEDGYIEINEEEIGRRGGNKYGNYVDMKRVSWTVQH
jgi:hypothetical protein